MMTEQKQTVQNTLNHYLASINANHPRLLLNLPGLVVSVAANSSELLNTLRTYFQPVLAKHDAKPQCNILLVDQSAFPEISKTPWKQWPWQEWKREPGKTGRKDAVLDFSSDKSRLIYKYKTDVLFWQRMESPAAFGPLSEHPNQVVNFILNQSLNAHQRQGWILGHAAGLSYHQIGLAIAGLSGGGKSTLMLRLLNAGAKFISNDRVLFHKRSPEPIQLRGIPKHPRVNPGTLLHNPTLTHLLSETRQKSLSELSKEALWTLEEKYDVDVERIYGEGTYQGETLLNALIILDWSSTSSMTTQFEKTTLRSSPRLLPAIMKSPGPFYHALDTGFLENGTTPKEEEYLNALGDVPCWVLSGGVDFEAATQWIEAEADNLFVTQSKAHPLTNNMETLSQQKVV